MRRDLFRAEEAAANMIKESGEVLEPEKTRLVATMLLDGIRAGLALSETEFEELKTTRKELSNTCLEFDVSIVYSTCTLPETSERFIEKLQ